MTPLEKDWRNISPGLFLAGFGAILAWAPFWQWVFVLVAGMSVMNALVKRRWLRLPHALMWTAGLSWSYATGKVGGWPMFFMLCGGSIVLSAVIAQITRRKPPPPPPPARPGEGVVIDV